MSKTNPATVLASWTFDPLLLPDGQALSPAAPPDTLRIAQAILVALDPYPDAYQAVLTALRELRLTDLERPPR